MNLLLDTHIVLWFLNGDDKLSDNAKNEILNPDNHKFVSMTSFWEISIKLGLKKLFFDGGTKEVFELVEFCGFEILPIEKEHIMELETLPEHHKDPFDRLIIASAISENFTIVSADSNFPFYDVNLII